MAKTKINLIKPKQKYLKTKSNKNDKSTKLLHSTPLVTVDKNY